MKASARANQGAILDDPHPEMPSSQQQRETLGCPATGVHEAS
jgi:hypothetical protein